MVDLTFIDPADCWDTGPFGFGPFPRPCQSVVVCPPHPASSGYGGVGWAENPYSPPPEGAAYGFFPTVGRETSRLLQSPSRVVTVATPSD